MSTKILLLQQNEGVRQAKSLVFGGAYFHSLELGGEEAVQDYLSREKVDLILNDCRGAEAKGLEWVEGLRKEQPKAKVVLVTEAMDLPMIIRSIRLGVKDVFAGPLDVAAISRSLGDLTQGSAAQGDALRKADWSGLNDFFQGAAPSATKAGPPSGARRQALKGAEPAGADALQEERRQLAEDSARLKHEVANLEKRRAEVSQAEQRLREREASAAGGGSPLARVATADETALRRERESLRMQVLELESERDLLQKQLADKEAELASALSALSLQQAGKSAAASVVTQAPFAPPPGPSPEAQELAAAQRELAHARERLAALEAEAVASAEREATPGADPAEVARWQEQARRAVEERDQAREFLAAKEKALASATATLQRLQTEVREYEKRVRELERASHSGEHTDRQEREQRVAQLASLEAERDFLREQITAMEADLTATRETVERLQREAVSFAEQLAQAQRLHKGGDEALRAEHDKLLAKVARLESERQLSREHLSGKEKALAEAQALVQTLRHELVVSAQRTRERDLEAAQPGSQELLLQRELTSAQEKLGLVELERDHARDQVAAKEAALAVANATVESLRGELDHYLERLRQAPLSAPTAVPVDEALRQERDQLRQRLSKAERERDQARELLQAKERALQEAGEALRRVRADQSLSLAQNQEEFTRREAEVRHAEERLQRLQSDVQSAQARMDEAWATLQAEQDKVAKRKQDLDEAAVSLANRERLLQLERLKQQSAATGAEEVGASERRLRLLRTEMSSLASALNARESALRTQELRVEQMLAQAETELRAAAAKEGLLERRAEEIERRLSVAEAEAQAILAEAKARAEAEEQAQSGLSEALRREREAVRKAEARYLAACREVGEQLQAMAEREAGMRRREYLLDERENSIRSLLNRVLTETHTLARGEKVEALLAQPDAKADPAVCERERAEFEAQKTAFQRASERIAQLGGEIDQEAGRKF